MIADTTFSSFVLTDVLNNLRAIGEEFDEAVRQGNLTETIWGESIVAL